MGFIVSAYAAPSSKRGKGGKGRKEKNQNGVECFGKLGKDAGTLWRDFKLCKVGRKSLEAEGSCDDGVTCTRGDSSLTVCKKDHKCAKSKEERQAAREAEKKKKKAAGQAKKAAKEAERKGKKDAKKESSKGKKMSRGGKKGKGKA